MGHEHNPADVYPALLKAFNAGDIDATVACYELQACFVLKSGHAVRGAAELREMFRATFSYKPDLELDVRKIISAGDDLALLQTSSNHRRTISKIDLDRKCPIQVLFPRGAPFLPELEAELLAFPRGKTDDQVDSISQALAYKPGYNLAALAS